MIFSSKNKIKKRVLEGEIKTKRSRFSRFLFYFLTAAFLAVSAYAFIFSPFLQIKKIYIRGLSELKYEEVREASWGAVGIKYFNFFSRNNLLLLSTNDLESKLSGQFKKISSVKVEKKFPDTLIISVNERKALLIWCSAENCFIIDEKGMAYASADFDSSEMKENSLIIIRDQSQSPVSFGQAIVSQEIVEFLSSFRKEISDRMAIELEREFKTPKSISGDFLAKTEEGWEIKLNEELGAVKEAEMLQIVLEKNIREEQRKELEYVDLRTADKVYYKFKNINSGELVSEERE